jgi:drug/metabolite transporter (DMT)-like permease
VLGALVWGVVWYPYRELRSLGLAAEWATILTYGFALVCLIGWYRGRLFTARPRWEMLLLMLAAGCANVGFLVAAIYGEVVRVTLLFYLAPVWTVFFARALLRERASAATLGATALALSGALVMLWNPALGAPWPKNGAEWIALGAGVTFALANVMIRRAGTISIEVKSFYIFLGCVLLSAGATLFTGNLAPRLLPTASMGYVVALILLVGFTMLMTNFVVQYGLTRTPANQAIVIYLSELVFAAVSAWLLAGETLDAKSVAGGGLIVCASLISAWRAAPMNQKEP